MFLLQVGEIKSNETVLVTGKWMETELLIILLPTPIPLSCAQMSPINSFVLCGLLSSWCLLSCLGAFHLFALSLQLQNVIQCCKAFFPSTLLLSTIRILLSTLDFSATSRLPVHFSPGLLPPLLQLPSPTVPSSQFCSHQSCTTS